MVESGQPARVSWYPHYRCVPRTTDWCQADPARVASCRSGTLLCGTRQRGWHGWGHRGGGLASWSRRYGGGCYRRQPRRIWGGGRFARNGNGCFAQYAATADAALCACALGGGVLAGHLQQAIVALARRQGITTFCLILVISLIAAGQAIAAC